MMHWITKRYVTRLYYDNEKQLFTSVTWSLFLRENVMTFQPRDIERPEGTGFMYTVKVFDKPLFFDMNAFTSKEAYGKLMGFDVPIDFRK